LPSFKDLLAFVPLYIASQRVLGADRLRYRCLDLLAVQPGECVLDIGCGPAYYFDRLPQGVRYFGFDTSARYIEYARGRYGSRGATFENEIFADRHVAQLPPINAVMLLGLLHHLTDDQCRELLGLAGRALAPGGRLISLDLCRVPGQDRISQWFNDHDRGKYVRPPDQYLEVAGDAFDEVDAKAFLDVAPVPLTSWVMLMRSPVTTGAGPHLAVAETSG
jgi:SAM-dependent methyltransferase